MMNVVFAGVSSAPFRADGGSDINIMSSTLLGDIMATGGKI